MEPPSVIPIPLTVHEAFHDRFLVKYPWMGPLISVMYLIMTKVLQTHMENRPAYKLKTIMRIYNVLQVAVCSKLVLMSLSPLVWSTYFNEICPPHDFRSPFYLVAHDIGLLFIILKLADLCDTVFIVLRKKESHLSFLHLFHHCSMVGLSCYGYYEGEGVGLPVAVLNCFIHVVMYTYFFIASFKSQRWIYNYKKYVTQMQLMQFIAIGLYIFFALYNGCQMQRSTIIIGYIVLSVITFEFGRFYITNYIKRKIN